MRNRNIRSTTYAGDLGFDRKNGIMVHLSSPNGVSLSEILDVCEQKYVAIYPRRVGLRSMRKISTRVISGSHNRDIGDAREPNLVDDALGVAVNGSCVHGKVDLPLGAFLNCGVQQAG